jgi:hypothetical protein
MLHSNQPWIKIWQAASQGLKLEMWRIKIKNFLIPLFF